MPVAGSRQVKVGALEKAKGSHCGSNGQIVLDSKAYLCAKADSLADSLAIPFYRSS
jgi:hypothetical protein